MSRGGMVMMVVILTVVWGGFAVALAVAMIQDRRGRQAVSEQGEGATPNLGRETPADQGGD